MVRLLVVLLAVVALIGLAPAAPVPKHLLPKDGPLYHPVQKGTRWVYLDNGAEYHYELTAADPTASGTTVVTISQMKNGEPTPYRKVEVSERGLLWTETVGIAFDTPACLLRCPVQPGDAWAYSLSRPNTALARAKGTMKVPGTETVEVPAGKFAAVRVDEKRAVLAPGLPDTNLELTSWYAPNVGQVKWVCGKRERVLKSFTPAKD
ncbi:hypothetical protein J8F10_13455 [Gemmata sp. G18]|uniref:DUF3108 domain-containing protein n=1 Tax=Gemmata palustris TaxID=2822762 RepID=A0ABS5BRL1_9BACT|nr:hypothetical protein [Gemmata palustris]MBP3956291.1 hypothetical protein [Gemmata palustris]